MPPPALALVTPAPSPELVPLLVEAVVCAAADVFDAPPRSVRAALRAAFERAEEAHLMVEMLAAALRGKNK